MALRIVDHKEKLEARSVSAFKCRNDLFDNLSSHLIVSAENEPCFNIIAG
jgi:hypothetical protein